MKFIPYDYQKYCIDRIITDDKIALFLDMGLGKTVITLTAINELRYNRFEVKKVLIIAPKKVAEDTWTREIQKWEHLKLLRVSQVLGTVIKRINALNKQADIYVTNRENVQWLVNYYKNNWDFDMVVIDELSSFKDPKTNRFKSLKCIRNHIKKIVGLTGTPAPNGLINLWSQIYLLDQGQRLGKSITAYRQAYFNPDKRNQNIIYTYKIKPDAEDIIKKQIDDICISLKAKDYIQLPDRIDDVKYIKLDTKSAKAYEELEKNMLLNIDDTTIDVTSAAALTNKLLQLCNGAVYDENGQAVEIHNCKIEAFIELIEALNGKPALVFYNFKHDLERIKKALDKMKLRVGLLKSSKDIKSWNDGEIDILLTHPASAAYGLNLQDGGHHIIWFGLTWSLELYLQANARLYRQGQTEKVIIHHLVVANRQDEIVMKALENKNDMQETLLNALKLRIAELKRSC